MNDIKINSEEAKMVRFEYVGKKSRTVPNILVYRIWMVVSVPKMELIRDEDSKGKVTCSYSDMVGV